MAKTMNLLWSCALVVALGCGAWADQTQTRIWSGELNIPNGGQVVQDLEFPVLSPGARVTQVDYEVTVDDWNKPENFWCSDYEIYIGNQTRGAFNSAVWHNQGGKTDGGQDSDAEDDSDVDVKGSLMTQFDGDAASQKWYVAVRDTVTSHSSSLQGLGRLTYVRLTIHYVVPQPDLQDAGEAYRVVSPNPVTPGDTVTVSCKVRNGGDLLAGLALSFMDRSLQRLPGLFILIPAAIGMRGNIFGALGSRLGTGIHSGIFEPDRDRRGFLGQNVMGSTYLTLATCLFLGPAAHIVIQVARHQGRRVLAFTRTGDTLTPSGTNPMPASNA